MWQWFLTFVVAWFLAALSGCAPASSGSNDQPDPGPCDGYYAGRALSDDAFATPLFGNLALEDATWLLGSMEVELAIDAAGVIRDGQDEVGTLNMNTCAGSATLTLGEGTLEVTLSRVPCSPENELLTDTLAESNAGLAGRWVLTEPNIPAELAALEFDETGALVSMDYEAEIGLIGTVGPFTFDEETHDLADGSGTYIGEANTFLDVQGDTCLGFNLDVTQNDATRRIAWLFSGSLDETGDALNSVWSETLIEDDDAETNSFFVIDWVKVQE